MGRPRSRLLRMTKRVLFLPLPACVDGVCHFCVAITRHYVCETTFQFFDGACALLLRIGTVIDEAQTKAIVDLGTFAGDKEIAIA